MMDEGFRFLVGVPGVQPLAVLSVALAAQLYVALCRPQVRVDLVLMGVVAGAATNVPIIQVEGKSPPTSSGRQPYPFGNQWPFGDDFLRHFFGDRLPRIPHPEAPQSARPIIGQGSGFIFAAEDGLLPDITYILTNNHVVENAEKIRVKFQNGREFDAEIKGSDPQSDVAVIKIEEGGLPALSLANSAKLEVGEWVIALGNPFGLSHTLTVGVVSAKGRTSLGINDYEDFIQTDAAINPGNSGGPLVNLNGEVVGINTAIFTRSGGYMGVGFAIPINLVKVIANQLIAEGTVTRGFLGVVIQDLTSDLAESFDIEQTNGILVAQVSEGSPAEKAGLQQGDVIVAYQDKPVISIGGFRNRVSLTSPGSRERLTIMRDGKRRNINITIGKLTDNRLLAGTSSQSADKLGLTVQTLTPELAKQFDTETVEGVVVFAVRPNSIAASSGIQPGTVILQVNQEVVRNATEFKQAVGRSLSDKRVLLLIKRGDIQQFLLLSW